MDDLLTPHQHTHINNTFVRSITSSNPQDNVVKVNWH